MSFIRRLIPPHDAFSILILKKLLIFLIFAGGAFQIVALSILTVIVMRILSVEAL